MMTEASLPSPGRRLLITVTVMAATLMQILDTTIANVALPHMQAALSATPESVVWVLTSYIIMAAIATPITGWLETRFGRRNLFAISIAGFTLSSALCGMAASLEMMVASRALQGLFGAFIGPLGQATLLDSTPREKHPQAMLIWGMGVMVGPILGPVLGGWLTDNYGWRWVFFINLPIGVVATVGIWLLLDKFDLARRSFDLVGFALLGIALASLQLMLDRGSQRDWFQSTEILVEAGLALGTFWMFVVHTITTPHPLLSLALFRDRNFVIAVIFTMMISGVMMAGSALMAPLLQVLMGYDAKGAGFLMMPRGLGIFVAMPLAAFVSKRIDPRILIAFGLMLTATSLWIMTGFDLEMGKEWMIYSGLVQGAGMGFAFLPLNVLAFSTLPGHLRTEGASLYNLARSVGGSVTISLMGALLSRNVQVSHADLGAHITSTSLPFIESGIIEQLGVRGNLVTRMIDTEINRQALMVAYLDDFWVMQWTALLLLPLVLFMRRGERTSEAPSIHLE
jgi:MFS transporter, DHA2 family, multidrug resistance protein